MDGIEHLIAPVSDADYQDLARLLVDAVDSGASVSFLAPLTLDRAEAWWRDTVASAREGAVFLVARDDEGIVGSVQMHPAWAPNQPHRADIAKLIVHRRGRRQGLATQLMTAVEEASRAGGYTLLTLDTVPETPADTLYRQLGWTAVGRIPDYALDPAGVMTDTMVFYKKIAPDRTR
jgi:GNAT superfamily N-acetyltransferase